MSLKELREAAGLTQQELGERLAKVLPSTGAHPEQHQSRISSYETGRNRMPLQVAVALTDLLNHALRQAGSDQVATAEAMLHSSQRPKKRKPRR
jgi:transcriptional regulator with XRE-family HTH domain